MIAVDWVSLVLSFAVGAVYGGTLIAAWMLHKGDSNHD
jgi:hypothetical protein